MVIAARRGLCAAALASLLVPSCRLVAGIDARKASEASDAAAAGGSAGRPADAAAEASTDAPIDAPPDAFGVCDPGCSPPTPVCSAGTCVAIAALASGHAARHTCALLADGSVWCWGGNDTGQLGDATVDDRPAPGAVSVGVDATSLALGAAHTCALGASGSVACWGDDTLGQVSGAPGAIVTEPAQVVMLSSVRAIAAGRAHTCALVADGRVRCWGANDWAQLGDGTNIEREGIVDVAGVMGATRLAAGADHACALVGESVTCWGRNDAWQLGNGAAEDAGAPGAWSAPVGVLDGGGGALASIGALSLGAAHGCALAQSGRLFCWGDNALGAFGDGTVDPSAHATLGFGGDPFTRVAAGTGTTCALGSSGLWCAGRNDRGNLGNGTSGAANQPIPSAVVAVTGATAVSVYEDHGCALTAAGEVLCWGDNRRGQLGSGSVDVDPVTVPVGVAW